MTGSVAPRLPSSGWRVLYRDALATCLDDARNLEHASFLTDWIVACRRDGPPPDGVDAGEDFHLSAVPGTRLVAEYLIIEAEFLIVVKSFR